MRRSHQSIETRHSVQHDESAVAIAEDDQLPAGTVIYGSSNWIFRNEATTTLATPWIWIAAGTSVFLAAWLFPPSLYARFYGVESRVFLDMPTLIYSLSCILCTCIGVWFAVGGGKASDQPRLVAGTDLDDAPNTRIAILLLMILANLISVGLFVRSGGVAALKSSLRGDTRLNEGMSEIVSDSGGSLWTSALVASSVFMPLAYQLYRTNARDIWTRLLVIIFAGTYVIAAMLTSRRNLLAKPLLGVLIVYLIWPSRRGLTRFQAMSVSVLAAAFVLVLFLALGYLRRGIGGPDELISEPLRYLLTPYNTQALMQNGALVVPGSSKGYYWTEWIWKFPVLDDLLGLEDLRSRFLGEKGLTGVTERFVILKSQGVYTATSFPAFACSWLDFGWLGPIPFVLIGWIAGYSWRGLLKGRSGQIMMFPVVAYSFVEWRANLLFPSITMDYALVLMAVTHICLALEKRRSIDEMKMSMSRVRS